jgi:hypothetical protein
MTRIERTALRLVIAHESRTGGKGLWLPDKHRLGSYLRLKDKGLIRFGIGACTAHATNEGLAALVAFDAKRAK